MQPRPRSRELRPAEVAWSAVVPCGIALLAAIVVLGPPLGHAFLAPGSERLWPPGAFITEGRPEPTKHARYLISLLGPLLLAGAVAASARSRVRLPPLAIHALVLVGQLATVAFLTVAVLGQRNLIDPPEPRLWPIFSVRTLEIAAILAAAVLALVVAQRQRRVGAWVAWAVRDTRLRRVACFVLAVAATAVWGLLALSTDGSVGDSGMMDWTIDDPFAILNGRVPLVDFHAFYAQLSPYVGAAAMAVFGTNTFVFTLSMTVLTGFAVLAIYAVFLRVVGSPLLALGLFLPFVSTGFLYVRLDGSTGLSNIVVLGMWPLRYAGAYLVAWLTARHLDGAPPRRTWLLFVGAGLVALDNLEFGIAAFAATVVALAIVWPSWSWQALRRLAGAAAGGLLCAAALVALLALVRSGRLPDFSLMLEFPHIFGVLGLISMPMPTFGFHLALYATYVAAIAVAVVRAARRDAQPLLTGMLAWSGVFGLISGGYYLGRSDTLKLVSLFSAWSFALMLLVVVVVRALAARRRRLPSLAELAVLFGLGLAICSVSELPKPWKPIDRLTRDYPPARARPASARFVDAHTRPGERVVILIAQGHRIAYNLGLVNVSPYTVFDAVVTRRQFRTVIDAARREGAHKLFFAGVLDPQRKMLARAGFRHQLGRSPLTEVTDDTVR